MLLLIRFRFSLDTEADEVLRSHLSPIVNDTVVMSSKGDHEVRTAACGSSSCAAAEMTPCSLKFSPVGTPDNSFQNTPARTHELRPDGAAALGKTPLCLARLCHSHELTRRGRLMQFEYHGWEEMTEAGMTQLLRSCLARSAKESAAQVPPATQLTDTLKLKKHISLVLERLSKGGQLSL